jgi:hypothetical protein
MPPSETPLAVPGGQNSQLCGPQRPWAQPGYWVPSFPGGRTVSNASFPETQDGGLGVGTQQAPCCPSSFPSSPLFCNNSQTTHSPGSPTCSRGGGDPWSPSPIATLSLLLPPSPIQGLSFRHSGQTLPLPKEPPQKRSTAQGKSTGPSLEVGGVRPRGPHSLCEWGGGS